MSEPNRPGDPPSIRALNIVGNAVYQTIHTSIDARDTVSHIEREAGIEGSDVAEMALLVLCMVIRSAGLKAEHIRRIFDLIRAEEYERR